MKVIAYAVRPDEKNAFEMFSKELDIELTCVNQSLSLENAHLALGHDGVSILGNCDASQQVLEKLNELKIKFVASRSAGYDNIDVEFASKKEIYISNATYSPNSVAEFALMLILMVNRKVVEGIQRNACKDFSLRALQGKELRNQTVGIIGTGRIGATLAKNLTGFGCRILAYDAYKNPSLDGIVEYVELDALYAQSDVISLHIPFNQESYKMVNASAISKMKDGAILINTARGELIDTESLIFALKSGKLSGVGLDVLDGELGIYHQDCRFKQIQWDKYATLKQLSNVVLTGHFAFYTDQAVSDMVECSLKSLRLMILGEKSPWQIN